MDAADPTAWDGTGESGLYVAWQAVEKTDTYECNEGFLRSDTILHVIVVSDTPDGGAEGWSAYVDHLVARRGDLDLVRVSAVTLDTSGACTGPFDGTGYAEAVAATGGVLHTLCDDWDTTMTDLAAVGASEGFVRLSKTPAVASITVTVNGVPTSNWTYDASWNALFLDPAVAGTTDAIVVSYGVSGACL